MTLPPPRPDGRPGQSPPWLSPRIGRILLILVLVAVALIVFWPGPPAADSQRWLARWLRAVHQTWMPHWVTFELVEFLSNVVMFLPVGLLGAIAFPRFRRWVVPACAVLSGAIELGQYLLLPARQGSISDIIANTLGGAIGLGIAILLVRRTPRGRIGG